MTNLDQLLDQISGRRPKLIDLGLARVQAVLAALGSPEQKLPPTFHIAGTNGKGSTVAFLKAILEASGKSVHVYTSPHLVRFNERVVIAGHEISDEAFIDVLARCDEAAGDDPLSFFETLTCAAFLAFSETPADACIIEVGLGGRLDATNMLSAPAATLITPVAMDHQDYLGDTVADIAGEKAGIMKPFCPAIIGRQSPDALATILSIADQVGARTQVFASDWEVRQENGRLIYQDADGLSDVALPRLNGAHQIDNAGLAIAALKAAEIDVSDEVISKGLENVHWPARLHQLREGPLIEQINKAGFEPEVWLDGGHNSHAAQAIAAFVAEIEEKSSKPLYMIFGMQANKDAVQYLSHFNSLAKIVVAVKADRDSAAEPLTLIDAAAQNGMMAVEANSIEDALVTITEMTQEPFRLLICGSLYLAGDVLRQHQ